MSQTFKPTHQIVKTNNNGAKETIPVRELDGCLYTQEEWEADARADWELVEEKVLFQGQVPIAREYRIEVAK